MNQEKRRLIDVDFVRDELLFVVLWFVEVRARFATEALKLRDLNALGDSATLGT